MDNKKPNYTQLIIMAVMFAAWMFYARTLTSQKPEAPPPQAVTAAAASTLPGGLQLHDPVATAQFQKTLGEEQAADKSVGKDEKKKHLGKAIEYLQQVVKQQKDTDPDSLTASIEMARLQATDAIDQKQAAATILNGITLLRFPPNQPQGPQVSVNTDGKTWSLQPAMEYASETYGSLVVAMNRENSGNFAYKFFHFFVGIFQWAGQYKDALALIILGVLVTVLMTPVRNWQYRSMSKFAKMQPEMKKIQEQYKGQPEELHRQSMALYKTHGANPMTGCLPMLAQIPFMWWLWYAIRLYQFNFKGSFLWIGSAFAKSHVAWATPKGSVMAVNLGHPDLILVLLYAVSMYFSSKFMPMTTADPEQQKQSMRMSATMSLFMPVMFYFYNLPSAFILWSLAMNVAQILVTVLYLRHHPDLKAMYEASAAARASAGASERPTVVKSEGVLPASRKSQSIGASTSTDKASGASSKASASPRSDGDGKIDADSSGPVRRIEPRTRRKGKNRRF